MGIEVSTLKCLLLAKVKYGADFAKTAMIGRQSLYASRAGLGKALALCFPRVDERAIANIYDGGNGYSEELLKYLGAVSIDSFDMSDYEGATVTHDMNKPIPRQYAEQYSLVMDFGTLEHIYDCPVAFRNEMEMVMPGGNFICCVPTNNNSGHGFYQFSPEFFYSTLRPCNGFEVIEMYAVESNGKVCIIKSPIEVKRRVEVITGKSTLLFVLAKKLSSVPDELQVYQSDYVDIWNGDANVSAKGKIYAMLPHIPKGLKRIVPAGIKRRLKGISRDVRKININRELIYCGKAKQ